MTRQEKESTILAYCEEVTNGYDTPRGAGFVTIQRGGDDEYTHYMVRWTHVNGGPLAAMVEVGRLDRLENIDLLYLLLGLETRALEAEIERLKAGVIRISMNSVNMNVWDDLEALIATFATL